MNAVTLHRLGYWAYVRKIPLIPQLVKLVMLLIYNSRISSSCRMMSCNRRQRSLCFINAESISPVHRRLQIQL